MSASLHTLNSLVTDRVLALAMYERVVSVRFLDSKHTRVTCPSLGRHVRVSTLSDNPRMSPVVLGSSILTSGTRTVVMAGCVAISVRWLLSRWTRVRRSDGSDIHWEKQRDLVFFSFSCQAVIFLLFLVSVEFLELIVEEFRNNVVMLWWQGTV